MEVSSVLAIYGSIFLSAHSVFTHSSDSVETLKCNVDDLSHQWSAHGTESFGEPRPYVISFNVSEPSFPQHLIKLYNRARSLPSIDYLLYKKGDFAAAIIFGMILGQKYFDLNYGDYKIHYVCNDTRMCGIVSTTHVRYVQILRVNDQTMCFAVHPESISFSVVARQTSPQNLRNIAYEFSTMSSFLFNCYKNASASGLPGVVAAYNGTTLSFISETCSDDDDELYPTLPQATTTVNVIDTKCTIDLLGKWNWTFLPYRKTWSNVSVVNLTGSERTVSRFLWHLTTVARLCVRGCRKNLVSLDISYTTFYIEDSQLCFGSDIIEMPNLHVIQKFYARNIIQNVCILYMHRSCILARRSACCGQSNIICIEPETMELLNIAENSIEYIDTSLTNALTGLKVFDISSNRLHSRNGGADINLGKMTSLTEFYCSNNTLKTLTAGIFDELSILTVIDLSFNKLTSITFRLQHLHQLRQLNLFKNEITLSESLYRGELTSLVMNQTTPSVQINIAENPLVCSMSCKTKVVLTWLLEHETDIRFSPLSCELRHNSMIINTRTLYVEAVAELCRGPLYTGIACLLGTLAAAVVISTALAVYRHRLSLRRERRIRNRIRNFKEDAYRERFPVFLSFSSINTDFVIKNVFEELNRRLQELLGTNRRCVAFGDADFRPGALVVEEMIHCISRCDVVIVCVSNDFLRSLWCTDEVQIMHFMRKPIILMFLEQADKKLLAKSILQRYFSAACRAKWIEVDGRLELQPDWNVLCESVVSRLRKYQDELDEGDTLV